MLEKFFAVTVVPPDTATSLFEVMARGENGCPCICKIESRSSLKRKKKKKYAEIMIMSGHLLAVAKWLQFFNPKELSSERPERILQKVNTFQWQAWQGGTPPIVALFLTEDRARECFCSSDLKPCDPRWRKDTKEVLAAIGENHPAFVVCRGRWKYWRGRALVY